MWNESNAYRIRRTFIMIYFCFRGALTAQKCVNMLTCKQKINAHTNKRDEKWFDWCMEGKLNKDSGKCANGSVNSVSALIESVLLAAAWGCALLSDARWRHERITRGGGAERNIASHRMASSLFTAHTATHWGSYPYRGAARITRNTVRKTHSRGFIVTALQVKLLSINLCFHWDLYMWPTLGFIYWAV